MAQRQCIATLFACALFISKVNASAWLPAPGETMLIVNHLVATPESHQRFQNYKIKFDQYSNLCLDLQKLYQRTVNHHPHTLGKETGYLDSQLYHQKNEPALKILKENLAYLISKRDSYAISSLDALSSIYLEQGITPNISLGFKMDYAAHSSTSNISKILSHNLINKIQLAKSDKVIWSLEQQVHFQHSHTYFIHEIEYSVLRGSNNKIGKMPFFTDLKVGGSKGIGSNNYLNLELTQGLKITKNWMLLLQSRNTLYLDQNLIRQFTKLSQQYSLAYTLSPSIHGAELTIQASMIVDHFNFADKPSFFHSSLACGIWLKIP